MPTKPKRPVTHLGQVFTPPAIVREMLALRRNHGTTLEPAAGAGAFLTQLGSTAIGIELDRSLPPLPNLLYGDFFAHPLTHQYDTIIGNPPYIRYQDILPSTRARLPMHLFDHRTNLYLFFIAKSIQHLTRGGELIFITPRDFLKATSARHLNQLLYEQGSFTYYRDTGDTPIFKGYSPNCAIWRWQKGLTSRTTHQGATFHYSDGQLWFSDHTTTRHETLSDHFHVKVGAVSGADHLFTSAQHGNISLVCSTTVRDGHTRRMIYYQKHPALQPHKSALLSRKIRPFHEHNWWHWGRKYHHSTRPRIYVNCKTRQPAPFFIHPATAYDGSVLALIPKSKNIDLHAAADQLNRTDWQKLGFVTGGRLLFTQRSLANAPFAL